MWLFIATELLIFGGLFCVYLVFRVGHPELFAYGSRFLDTGWGAINTAVLIVSSVMMALAVRSARCGHHRHTLLFLGLTLICAVDFLGVKFIEYREKVHDNLVGGVGFYERAPNGPDGPIAMGAVPRARVERGNAENGEAIYATSCAVCHGLRGEGRPAFGRPLAASAFIAGLDDEGLLDFLRTGRSIDDPLNTTGIPMLPRGGNPLLTDQQLAHVVAFMRTLQPDGPGAADEQTRGTGSRAGSTNAASHAAVEYGPLVDPRLDPQRPANAHLFFSIYFLMTGVHAVHVLAGMGVITAFMVLARRRRLDFTTIDLGGLYWHFVDIVWIFIFPALYLIG